MVTMRENRSDVLSAGMVEDLEAPLAKFARCGAFESEIANVGQLHP
jgi:hypothetical protein